MKILLSDTLTKSKREFSPINKDHIKVYACGPTVYNYAHLGNARMAVVTDLLIRVLKLRYKRVTFVSNITDVDDKIIESAKKEKISINELTTKFHKIYNEDMANLGVNTPDIQPKATEYIEEMIKMISLLIQNDCAYVSDGNVLFNVKNYKYYGELSGRVDEELIQGSRVKVEKYKKNGNDFVLWKPSKSDEPGWNSPWGTGRPGWHIECSAMSKKCLDIPFDIHCGGIDLIFPHHENEIAQSCSFINKDSKPTEFCNYWFHNGFVTYKGEKMSKSLGNIKLVRELLKNFEGRVIRLCLLNAHYKQPLDFSENNLVQFEKYISKIDNLFKQFNNEELVEESWENNNYLKKFVSCLFDDLNTPKALAELSSQVSEFAKTKNERLRLKAIFTAFNILGLIKNKEKLKSTINKREVENLINERNKARQNKDFKKADEIREKLKEMSVEIEDSKDGTKWYEII